MTIIERIKSNSKNKKLTDQLSNTLYEMNDVMMTVEYGVKHGTMPKDIALEWLRNLRQRASAELVTANQSNVEVYKKYLPLFTTCFIKIDNRIAQFEENLSL